MGKWSKYSKNFQNSWLSDKEFGKWVEAVKDNPDRAFCKLCKATLRAQKNDLMKHAATAKHVKNAASLVVPSIKTAFSEASKIPCLEIKIAAFVACHTSVRNVDHLSELLNKEYSQGSKDLKIHRTKCTAIIKNVIAPAILQEQIEEIKDNLFSLIIDESTDISCQKHLAICARFYSETENRIVSQFLGIVPVTVTTGEALYNAVKTFLEAGIDLKKCFALGTNGASNLCGNNNSLYSRLKKDNSNILLIKCICHSLHLTLSKDNEEN